MRRRFVALMVDNGEDSQERWSYGSGLLIGGQQVLTAAHVVQGAMAVNIHRPDDPVSWTADAQAMLVGNVERFDLAIIDVDEAESLDDVPVALVNRDVVGGEFIQDCWAVGFPAFQRQRPAPDARAVRETAQVGGQIPPLSGLRSHLLSLQVTAQPRPLPAAGALDDSEWSGMSGAPVFAADLLLGVVTEHMPDRGASDITVTPLDALLNPDHSPPHTAQWWRRLGVSDPSTLPHLPVPGPTNDIVTLEDVIEGSWVMDVHGMMGNETMRLTVEKSPGQDRRGKFQGEGIIGLPNWRANGTWQILPDERVAMQGVQSSPAVYPPQQPLQEAFLFTSVERNALQGENSARAQVEWRRA
jgi:Trypsin-like peptidase domain